MNTQTRIAKTEATVLTVNGDEWLLTLAAYDDGKCSARAWGAGLRPRIVTEEFDTLAAMRDQTVAKFGARRVAKAVGLKFKEIVDSFVEDAACAYGA